MTDTTQTTTTPAALTTAQEDALATIRLQDISNEAYAAAGALLERAVYTTTALYAIAYVLSEGGDEVGADLIRQFARKFAKHEATTL